MYSATCTVELRPACTYSATCTIDLRPACAHTVQPAQLTWDHVHIQCNLHSWLETCMCTYSAACTADLRPCAHTVQPAQLTWDLHMHIQCSLHHWLETCTCTYSAACAVNVRPAWIFYVRSKIWPRPIKLGWEIFPSERSLSVMKGMWPEVYCAGCVCVSIVFIASTVAAGLLVWIHSTSVLWFQRLVLQVHLRVRASQWSSRITGNTGQVSNCNVSWSVVTLSWRYGIAACARHSK